MFFSYYYSLSRCCPGLGLGWDRGTACATGPRPKLVPVLLTGPSVVIFLIPALVPVLVKISGQVTQWVGLDWQLAYSKI